MHKECKTRTAAGAHLVGCLPTLQKTLGWIAGTIENQVRQHRSIILVLRRWEQEDEEFRDILCYINSSRPSWSTRTYLKPPSYCSPQIENLET